MTKSHLTARCVLAILGVYVLNSTLRNVRVAGLMGHLRNQEAVFWNVITQVILVCLAGIAGYLLLFRSQHWAAKIAGSNYNQEQSVNRLWVVGALRIAMVFSGLLVVYSSIGDFVWAVSTLAGAPAIVTDAVVRKCVDEMFRNLTLQWFNLAAVVCRMALGIYLVLGAPHYVRWHVRRWEITESAKNN